MPRSTMSMRLEADIEGRSPFPMTADIGVVWVEAPDAGAQPQERQQGQGKGATDSSPHGSPWGRLQEDDSRVGTYATITT